jgi:hypothetical protein
MFLKYIHLALARPFLPFFCVDFLLVIKMTIADTHTHIGSSSSEKQFISLYRVLFSDLHTNLFIYDFP